VQQSRAQASNVPWPTPSLLLHLLLFLAQKFQRLLQPLLPHILLGLPLEHSLNEVAEIARVNHASVLLDQLAAL